MDAERFRKITQRYPELRIGVLGDFCLDRYLEIDPGKEEVSIETGLPVHNVTQVRAQPGGAGTILNNLSALGIGMIRPLGFVGRDGEGYELWHALEKLPGVCLDGMLRTAERRTFTYGKPLLMKPNRVPVELNRLDMKNWTPTPASVERELVERLVAARRHSLQAFMILDQVDVPQTGVVTKRLLTEMQELRQNYPKLLILADSRRGLAGYPPVVFKMNADELQALTGIRGRLKVDRVSEAAANLARANGRAVFITMADKGLLGAAPSGEVELVPALPLRGEIDVVGAGDAVSANLLCAISAGASLGEALELANAAASVVIHKLGTTGTASVAEIEQLLFPQG